MHTFLTTRPASVPVPNADEVPSSRPLLFREAETQGSLGSLPQAGGCSSQPHSYQNHTTSSMAKLARSISVGENPGLATEPQAPAPIRISPFNKLALPSRAHLVLDIPKPLPDRPALTTFSPVSKGLAHNETEQSGPLVSLGKAHTTVEKHSCLGEGTTHKSRTECQAYPGPNHPCAQQLPVNNLLQGPESLQPLSPEKTRNPVESSRPGVALSQDSGVHGSPVSPGPSFLSLLATFWLCPISVCLAFGVFVLSAPVLVHKSHL